MRSEFRAIGVAAVVPPGTLTEGLLRIVDGVLESAPARHARADSVDFGCALRSPMTLDRIVRRNAVRFLQRTGARRRASSITDVVGARCSRSTARAAASSAAGTFAPATALRS